MLNCVFNLFIFLFCPHLFAGDNKVILILNFKAGKLTADVAWPLLNMNHTTRQVSFICLRAT